MSARAVLLGLGLGFVVSASTYFNDWVIGQTQFIGNHLPISVFGAAVFLVLVVNPLTMTLMRRLALKGSEIALIVALGLAACGWPGSNFFRGFVTVSALPAHWHKTKANWQGSQVMSYVPGGSAELGAGHVQDWPTLIGLLKQASETEQPSPARQLWQGFSADAKLAFLESHKQGFDLGQAATLTRALNRSLASPEFYSEAAFREVTLPPASSADLQGQAPGALPEPKRLELHRALLAAWQPGIFLPAPEGEGVLLAGGRADPFAVDTLLQGRSHNNRLGLAELPWKTWWPTIWLWCSLALLLGGASLCMALIVHPQWSKRELLPYPIVRFIDEATEHKPGSRLPEVAKSNLFWTAFVLVVGLHLVNGLHAWFPEVPQIPRQYDFWGMQKLFPNAVRVDGQYGWFGATFYMSVIAFAFFMSTSVSFSLGIAYPLFFMLGAFLIAQGSQLDSGSLIAKKADMLRSGAYFSIALVIAYTGRRYYANVVKAACGLRRAEDTPVYAMWAMRALGLCAVGATVMLTSAGVGAGFAALLVGIILLTFLVATRVVTETGAFFTQTGWAPLAVISALFGFEAIGPTTYIILAIATVILVVDTRELLMPFLANGLKMVDRGQKASVARLAPLLLVMMLAGFAVAGLATLYLQYNHSVTQVGNTWGTDQLPVMAFDALTQYTAEAQAHGTLAAATRVAGWDRLLAMQPESAAWWLLAGLVVTLLVAWARLRLPWWPLHPVAFVAWGTYPLAMFGASFLVGWVVKALVVSSAGARGYHAVKPLMIGVIAAELLSGLLWMVIGALYFFATGKSPVVYSIFPL